MAQIFWISVTLIIYTYLGYPILIILLSKIFRKSVHLDLKSFNWPKVTVIIIAYNEEDNILRKIENCRALAYPEGLLEILVVSDGSRDGTNDILREQADIRTIIDNENHGKPHQINRAVLEQDSEIIVFSDARQTFEKNVLHMLIRNFSDPAIGAVSGELVFVSPEDHTELSIGLYWKYEKLLRKAESAVDSTLGVTGAIYATRSELFSPIPEDTILDDVEIPLNVFRKGYRVIFESEAKAYDTAATDSTYEFQRKIRTLAGNFQIFTRHSWLFNPLSNRIFFQALSHKLFRLLVPYALIAAFISSLLLHGSLYKMLFYAQLFVYSAGVFAILFPMFKKNRIFNFISVFLVLTAASVVAFFKYIFKRSSVKWRT